jgi:hypothetical protein
MPHLEKSKFRPPVLFWKEGNGRPRPGGHSRYTRGGRRRFPIQRSGCHFPAVSWASEWDRADRGAAPAGDGLVYTFAAVVAMELPQVEGGGCADTLEGVECPAAACWEGNTGIYRPEAVCPQWRAVSN